MSSLGPLTFLSPLYLVGLLSAAVPLVIHLSRSRRQKKLRFSTTRFFTDQFLRSYRMSRLKEVVLLACRMALCALLAMALARPFVAPRGGAAAAGGGDGPRAVVLVVDDSASMALPEGGATLFAKAKESAGAVLDGLRAGDRAALVFAGRRAGGPEAPFPEPTDRLDDVRQALDRSEVSALGTDLTGAVGRAEALLQGARDAGKEVYVFSDLQATGWDAKAEEEKPSDVSFVVVRVGPSKGAANVGVAGVRYAPSLPRAGTPLTVRPLLEVAGAEADAVTVRLVVDGDKVGEQRVERLPNGRWPVPRFTHTFAKGGWHSGHVEVEDRGVPQDNRRYFALEVQDGVPVLAVDGAPSDVRRLDELFFLTLALTAGAEGEAGPVKVEAVAPAALAGKELPRYPVVVLANVETLPPAAVEKLEEYAAGGGSLLFFLGDKVNPAFYNDTLAGGNRRLGGLLPCRLKAVEGDPAGGKDVATVGAFDAEHPALAPFADPKFAALAGPSVTFKALWRVEADPEAVVMRASTGAPLLCEKAFGKGKVMLFASTADRDWTNFPIRPAYLPWVHRLVAYLAQGAAAPQAFHHTGDAVPLSLPGDTPGPVLVKKPNGVVGAATTGGEDGNRLVFTDTALPGVYTVLAADGQGAAGRFAVNVPGAESRLRYLDDALAEGAGAADPAARRESVERGLKEWLGRPLVAFVDDPARLGESGPGGRGGRPLWDYVLAAVLALGLFEPWLANRISTRLYRKPREAPALAAARLAPATLVPEARP